MTLLLMFFLLSVSAFSQESFDYRMEGSFRSESTVSTDQVTVNFSLTWSETDSEIQGIYEDNYFTRGVSLTATGEITDDGRRFLVILPDSVFGVATLKLSTSIRGAAIGSVPLKITAEDSIGGVIQETTTFGLMRVLSEAEVPKDECVVGFGALTGHCGNYSGQINEVTDTSNRCNLAGVNPTLQLAPDTTFRYYPSFISGVPNPPLHPVGGLPSYPIIKRCYDIQCHLWSPPGNYIRLK